MLPSRAWVWQAPLTTVLTQSWCKVDLPKPESTERGVCGASDRRPPTGNRREPPVRAKLQNNNPGQDNTKPAGAHYPQKL